MAVIPLILLSYLIKSNYLILWIFNQ